MGVEPPCNLNAKLIQSFGKGLYEALDLPRFVATCRHSWLLWNNRLRIEAKRDMGIDVDSHQFV